MNNTSPNNTTPRHFGFSSGFFLPARLDAKLTAQVLGFQEHDIPVLVNRSLLEPLGKPKDNARKFFARVEVLEKSEDTGWLGKATRLLSQYWQDKNASRKIKSDDEESGHAE